MTRQGGRYFEHALSRAHLGEFLNGEFSCLGPCFFLARKPGCFGGRQFVIGPRGRCHFCAYCSTFVGSLATSRVAYSSLSSATPRLRTPNTRPPKLSKSQNAKKDPKPRHRGGRRYHRAPTPDPWLFAQFVFLFLVFRIAHSLPFPYCSAGFVRFAALRSPPLGSWDFGLFALLSNFGFFLACLPFFAFTSIRKQLLGENQG